MAAGDAKVVIAQDLSKVYGSGETEVVALDGVSTAFDRDRFTALMGPSGSGKSTLMHILAGLDTPRAVAGHSSRWPANSTRSSASSARC